jgi:DUF4097 and DUF4098 domain-containing protein YvlB
MQFIQRRKAILLLAIVLLILLVVGILIYNHNTAASDLYVSSNHAPVTEDKSFQVGDQPFVVIKGHASDVNVQTGNTGVIIVKALQHQSNQALDPNTTNILYHQITDAQGRNHLTISNDPVFRDVDYDVTVPASTQVDIEVDSGSVAVQGTSGATVSTGSGSVEVEDIRGPVNAATDSGDITLHNVNGQTVLNGESGSLHITGVTGQLKAVTHSGDVVVRDAKLSGQSALKTDSGSVRFDGSLDPAGTYLASTNSGDIDLTLPSNAAFQLAATTGSGNVNNAFGGNVIGSGPQAHITATIGSGSVTVDKAI